MPNRYRKYLEEREQSSRYTERLDDAQEKRKWLAPLAATVGLGILVAGIRSKAGRGLLSEIGKRLAPEVKETALEKSLLEQRAHLRSFRAEAYAEAKKQAGLKNLRLMVQDDTSYTSIHDAIVEISQEKGSRKYFLKHSKQEDFLEEILSKTDIHSLALPGSDTEEKTAVLRTYLDKAFSGLSRAQRQEVRLQTTALKEVYEEELLKKFQVKKEGFNFFGLRPLTVGDVGKAEGFDYSKLKLPTIEGTKETDFHKTVINRLVKKDERFKEMILDPSLFVSKEGQVVDFRGLTERFEKVLEGTKEFHLPFVGISPYSVLKLDHREGVKKTPFMHMFRSGEVQFLETKAIKEGVAPGSFERWRIDQPMVFVGSRAVDFRDPSVTLFEDIYLEPSQYGYAAKTLATFAGLQSGEGAERKLPKLLLGINKFLGLGEQEGRSFLGSSKTIFTKFRDPEWAGNAIKGISKSATDEELAEAVDRFRSFVGSETKALSDETFNKVFGEAVGNLGYDLDLSSDSGILQAFEYLATSGANRLSPKHRDLVVHQWYSYVENPTAYLSKQRTLHNKMADVGAVLSQFSDREVISKTQDIKRLVQQELMEQILVRDPQFEGSAVRVAEALLIADKSVNTKGTALNFALGHLDNKEIKDLVSSKSLLGQSAKSFVSSRAPWYGYGPIEESITSLLGKETDFLMARKPQTFGYKDILAAFNAEEKERAFAKGKIGKAFKQFFAGQNSMEDFTSATMWSAYPVTRMHDALSFLGVGLSPRHTSSTTSTFTNMITRRYLPAMLGIGLAGYLSWEMGNLFGVTGKEALANLSQGAKEDYAKVRDFFGVTKAAKKAKRITPGSEYFEELPGFGPLFFQADRSAEEVKEEREKDVPVRKGRYWFVGSNTPFIGGKVEYYEPSKLKQAKGDPEMTDVLYGSRDEYYAHAWFPTPRYPAAPIRHFITDPYWLEKKHYEDRPYPVTGPLSVLEDIPVVGPTLSFTVGGVLKPRRPMHVEEMNAASLAQEQVAGLNEQEKAHAEFTGGAVTGSGGFGAIRRDNTIRQDAAYLSIGGGQGRVAVSSINAAQIDKADGRLGGLSEEAVSPANIKFVAAKTYYGATEWSGLYGFMAEKVTGQPYEEMKTYQDPGRMTSSAQKFWDLNLGGLGGEWSEIGRRFIPKPKRYQEEKEYNPLKNLMPSWMPGEDYFLDFKHGDPFAKITKGEMRLPGGGFEAVHDYDPMEMKIRASMVGKSETEIKKYILGIREDLPYYVKKSAETGTAVHEEIQRMWTEQGIMHSGEQEVYDERTRASGHYDAIIRTKRGLKLVDIKTLSKTRYEELLKRGRPFEEHMDQVHIYMHATGLTEDGGGILYASRDPKLKPVMMEFDYDHKRYERIAQRLDKVRAELTEDVKAGRITRQELYDPLHRFLVLADVAPWSEEYRYYRGIVEEEYPDERYQKIIEEKKRQVAEKKKNHRFFPYRFRDIDIIKEDVTVTDVFEGGGFLTREYPDQRFDLAGIQVTEDRREDFKKHIYPGARLTVGVDKHEKRAVDDGSQKIIGAAIYSGRTNLSLEMLQSGIVQEKEEDWSPAGVHARFTPSEISTGSIWESFAHLDTPVHTKLLPVRSPLEEYKRRDVYGKSFQQWSIKDQAVPTAQSFISKSIIPAALSGGFLGAMVYGTTHKARLKGAAYGAAIFAGLSALRTGSELISGERWIPKRRRVERDINEYFDVLKYVKHQGLHEYASEKAKRARGDEKAMWQSQAARYKKTYQTTIYGLESEAPVGKLMAALPKKEREYMAAFLEAKPEEHKEILELVPENQKRFLQAAWGMEPDERPSLEEFFRSHYLPKADWEGWGESKDLDDIKVKVIKNEGQDLSEFGFWGPDLEKSRRNEAPYIPISKANRSGGDLRQTLRSILEGVGLKEVDVVVEDYDGDENEVDIEISKDRRKEIVKYVNSNLDTILV